MYKIAILSLSIGFAALANQSNPSSLTGGNLTVSSVAPTALAAKTSADMNDHYGNPDRFIRYIIRIPPVHA